MRVGTPNVQVRSMPKLSPCILTLMKPFAAQLWPHELRAIQYSVTPSSRTPQPVTSMT